MIPEDAPKGQKGRILKKRAWILIFSLAVLVIACLIFYFSAQDGPASSKTSAGLSRLLLRWLRPDFDSLKASQRNKLLLDFEMKVRKAAHFVEFAALGVFLHLLFDALKFRWKAPLAWLAGTLYACTDEWHQAFVGERTALWQDVCIDSGGVLFGVLLALLILLLRERKRKKAPATPET